MIGFIEKLTGVFAGQLQGSGVIIDVSGVGYGVEMPLSDLCTLGPIGSKVDLWVHTHVREDALKLFGFSSKTRRNCFDLLLSINGIGPKVALAILSTMDCASLHSAVSSGQPEFFGAVPGVGPKLAERLIVELKSKLKVLGQLANQDDSRPIKGAVAAKPQALFSDGQLLDSNDQISQDVTSALLNLGFKDKQISATVERLKKTKSTWTFAELLRGCLTEMSPKTSSQNPVAEV